MGSGLDKPQSNLFGTSEAKCNKCRGDVELTKVSDKCTAFFECERSQVKSSQLYFWHKNL